MTFHIPDVKVQLPSVAGDLMVPSMDIPLGTIALITGDNGAGKTTYLHALKSQLSRHVAGIEVLDQQYDALIYPYQPVWWNVSLPIVARGGSESEARLQAKRMLAEFELEVGIDKKAGLLSGGERHLLVLLRFLAAPFVCMLLDEPTSALHPRRVHQLETALLSRAARNDCVTLLVTHDSLFAELRSRGSQDLIVAHGFSGKPLTIGLYYSHDL